MNQAKLLIFLVSNERYDKNKTLLLRCYGINFAPIKRYRQFCSQAYMFYLNSIHNLCLFVYDCHMLLESLGQGYPSNPVKSLYCQALS